MKKLNYSRRSVEVLAFLSRPPEEGALPYFTYTLNPAHSFCATGELMAGKTALPPGDARAKGCAPLLCLSNLNSSGGFSPQLAHSLFCDEAAQDKLMAELFTKLEAGDYYGVQLCFNYLFPFDRDNYSRFVSTLSQGLHSAGYLLCVELSPPELSSSAQDYPALGEAADRLSLMFCRWAHSFSPPQALAPLEALHLALEQALEHIPAQRLLLGISGLGYDWKLPWHQGDEARAISCQRALELARSQNAELKRDGSSAAPWFLYRDAEARRHAVFFEDGSSIEKKLRLVDEFSLAGIALYPGDRLPQTTLQMLESLHSTEKLL